MIWMYFENIVNIKIPKNWNYCPTANMEENGKQIGISWNPEPGWNSDKEKAGQVEESDRKSKNQITK